ncbi:MAG TPA: hypothetical protein VHR45_16820 [Thermoanaerobaculia bacterium]|nr:hypothetical protein [Thermoanaerobaculia bacterium]
MRPLPHARSCRGLAAGAVLLAGLLLPGAAAPQPAQSTCAPPSGDTGFAEIGVNVSAGTFDKVLPFDVPVRLCGTLPVGTADVSVQFVEAATAAPVVDRKCHLVAPGLRWKPDPPISGRIDGTTFRAILPALEANRYYTFCFRRHGPVSAGVAAQFQPAAREVLDRGLDEVPAANLTQAQSVKLRTVLRDRLQDVLAADTILAEGTVFDPRPEHDELRGRFSELVRNVLDPQRRRDRILDGDPASAIPAFSERQFDLGQALKAVWTNAALARLTAQLERSAQTEPSLGELLAGKNLAAGVALTRADESLLAAIAHGRDPALQGGAPPPDLKDPAQAAAVASRYDATFQALSSLAALIKKLTDLAAPAVLRAGLGADDLAALRELAAGPLARASALSFTLAGLARDLQTSDAERSAALDALAAQVQIEAQGIQVVDGSSTPNFATAQNNYVSADAGLVYAPEIESAVTYVGVNLYLRPVNKDAHLSQLGSFRKTFTRRFAFTLALTIQSVADGGGGRVQTRQDLFGNQALIAGSGLRVTDMIRLGAGALVFKRKDQNPLINRFSVATTYYFTVSFDLNVARAFQGGFGGLFGKS